MSMSVLDSWKLAKRFCVKVPPMHVNKYSWWLKIAEKSLCLGPTNACQKVFLMAKLKFLCMSHQWKLVYAPPYARFVYGPAKCYFIHMCVGVCNCCLIPSFNQTLIRWSALRIVTEHCLRLRIKRLYLDLRLIELRIEMVLRPNLHTAFQWFCVGPVMVKISFTILQLI